VYTVDESNFSGNTAAQGFLLNADDAGDLGATTVTITETTASNNGLDGIALNPVSSDDDNVVVTIKDTVANGNGNAADSHGIFVTGVAASDNHDFMADIEQVTTNGNTLDGIHVDIDTDASFVVGLDGVIANSNDNVGVFVRSRGALPAPAEVVLEHVVAENNGDGDPTDHNVHIFESNGAASLDVELVDVRTSGANEGSNVFVQETGGGDVDVTLDGVVANGSVGDSGVEIDEAGDGDLNVHVDGKVSTSGNADDGVLLTEAGAGDIIINPGLDTLSGSGNGGVLARANGVIVKA